MVYINRKIENIFNNDSGKDEKASQILGNIKDQDDYVRLRRKLRIRNKENNPFYKCAECGTVLELSCMPNYEGEHTFYFKHFKDPGFDKCSIKTNTNRSIEEINRQQYAFKSESNAHIELKKKVGKIISLFHDSNVVIDKKFIHSKFGDSERRKPDIYFNFNNKEITIEFQINNTYHSVIQEREAFYESNRISLIWVFGEFDPGSFQSITVKDIYVPNGNNAFIFDDEAEHESYAQKQLCLKVYFKRYFTEDDDIKFHWEYEVINLKQLTYNPVTHRPFYFDCEKSKKQAHHELDRLNNIQKEKIIVANALSLAEELLDFLSRHKKKDYIFKEHDFHLLKLSGLSEFELSTINNKIGLNKLFKNNNNIIQSLLEDKNNHYCLISFLLKAKNITIPIQSINGDHKSTYISICEVFPHSDELIQLLFARGYKLMEVDKAYIETNSSGIELKKLNFLLNGYQNLKDFSQMSFFKNYNKEFLVIESSKNKKLTIIGNESQNLIWLANLAAVQYQKFWYYFDYAFKYYGFYKILFETDNNASFLKRYNQLKNQNHQRHIEFEKVLFALYPELNHPSMLLTGPR